MKIFVINGKEYKAKPFDFNLVCDLEDMGVPMHEMGRKRMSVTRAYFALCAGISNEAAGKEIEQHIIAGGTLEDLNIALNNEMEKSDFFRTLTQTTEEEVATDQSEKKQNTKQQESCLKISGFHMHMLLAYHGMNFGK